MASACCELRLRGSSIRRKTPAGAWRRNCWNAARVRSWPRTGDVQALAGVRIVVTRAASQAEELAQPLRDLGAEVLLLPMIEIGPPADPGPLRTAAARVKEYDWIVFTSANAVQAFAALLPEQALNSGPRIATVGESTRRAVEELGWIVSLTPAEYIAEALIESFGEHDLRARRI